VLKDYGTIDILVNAAGVFEYSGSLEGESRFTCCVLWRCGWVPVQAAVPGAPEVTDLCVS